MYVEVFTDDGAPVDRAEILPLKVRKILTDTGMTLEQIAKQYTADDMVSQWTGMSGLMALRAALQHRGLKLKGD